MTRKLQRITAWLVCLCALSLLTHANTPLTDYRQRVARAAELAQTIAKQAPATDAQLAQLQTLKQWLPAQEEIEASGQSVRVDNAWVHAALNTLRTEPAAQAAQLAELADRLAALQQRLADPDSGGNLAAQAPHDRLTRILSQPEYRQEQQQQESTIKQWITKILRKVQAWFRKLFSASPKAQPSQFTLNLTRLLIGGLFLLALLYALYKFFRWFGTRKRRQATESSPREILGEVIGETATTEDLLDAARALAAQGDYRGAIRRAYIALLFELEQRGKLRLHRAHTNRDYLDALRYEALLYPTFVALTRMFERIWYGHANATEFDFEGFLTGYREAVGGE
ncbi:MAG: DUF4129 domain-containing protein [Acidobacteria bacterium]|nr:DUF4129 domain-containing protein [Acidobacteriota bacterium]MBI3422973.1 DUF4129 domain-containing protein [Acidobacteriota bacterium]